MNYDSLIRFSMVISFFALYECGLLYIAYEQLQQGNTQFAAGVLILSVVTIPQLTWDSDDE